MGHTALVGFVLTVFCPIFSSLGGTRRQRLQLLFYILLPPKLLQDFLDSHPAGGVPLWLMEVGNDLVLSLASLSHYYWYGAVFTPVHSNRIRRPQKPKLVFNGAEAYAVLLSILAPSPSTEDEVQEEETKEESPTRKSSLYRRKANHQSVDLEVDVATNQNEVMDRILLEDRDGGGFVLSDFMSDEVKSRERFLAAGPLPEQSNMADFFMWANKALDESCLDAVMHRLFSHKIFPSPSIELELVKARWRDWQETECVLWSKSLKPNARVEIITQSVRKILSTQNGEDDAKTPLRKAFGGIGGFDGRGGVGYGVMYCIEKKWWDAWQVYVGWSWAGESGSGTAHDPSKNGQKTRVRPSDLSTESLLDRLDDNIVAGTFGSYELMKPDVKKDVDYVLIPSGVWDILYDLYGGGPPIPRMVLQPAPKNNPHDLTSTETDVGLEVKEVPSEEDLDAMASTDNQDRVLRIPMQMDVETHPWILHFHLCDTQQPYRRGNAGPMSIRVMALPDQPLWRLYAEIVVRLPFNIYRAYGADGRGRARLWKRTSPAGQKDALSRYGPWALLCKNRYALLPAQSEEEQNEENYNLLTENWNAYADNASVESIGLVDGDELMAECAVVNKKGEFIWPRDAAAKDGRARRLADKDVKFRRMLRGLDENGKRLQNPPDLVGMRVDAMDANGRWYEVAIDQVQTVVADTDDEEDSMEMESTDSYSADHKDSGEQKQVRVDFSEQGGHPEWINIESDRLASVGRFTLGNSDDSADPPKKNTSASNSNDGKGKNQAQVKKAEVVSEFNGKICTIPGYGACGLNNLGNTCYANAAIQCISYMPLLRAYLLSAQYKATGDLNKDNFLGTGGKLLEEFAELLRQMWSAKIGDKSPVRFRSQLGRANAQFSGADQQDAQEFLNYMLDVLHEDSNRVRKKPYVEGLEDDWVKKTNLSRVGEEAWRR